MTEQFERERLEVKFVEAVDAKVLEGVHENGLTKGDFANFHSHKKIWRDMLENEHTMAIVFEDQCKLAEGFYESVSKLKLPDRWDVIYLGYTGPRFFAPENNQLDRGKPVGTWCHLISLEGAKKLVNFDPNDFWLIPDNHLAFLPLRTFYIKNKIAWRDPTSVSVIGGNYIKRGCLKWLIVGHWAAHAFQFWPVLEILFLILFVFLVKRLV